ncbi:hypothetical protein [Wolbachia endosymbiont (group A) of Bibio marci]|nr:hypothetical protein [Wolbachia endosymbiont (group A) of Bibio marci]
MLYSAQSIFLDSNVWALPSWIETSVSYLNDEKGATWMTRKWAL